MTPRRRDVVQASAAAALGAVAGCSAFDGSSDDESGDDSTEVDSSTAPDDGWHSYQQSPENNALAAGTTVPDDPTERWRISLSGTLERQPVVGETRLYVITGDGQLHALDTGTGEMVWSRSLGSTGGQCPCIVDDLVVAGSAEDGLIAFDTESGDTEWTVDLATAADPTPYDGVVYVGTDEGTLHGIDTTSTEETLRVDVGQAVTTAPAVTDERLFVGVGPDSQEGAVLAVQRSSGDEQWRRENYEPSGVVARDRRILTASAVGLRFYTPGGEGRGQSSSTTVPVVSSDAIYTGGTRVNVLPLRESAPDWSYVPAGEGNVEAAIAETMAIGDGTLCVPYSSFEGEQPQTALVGLDAETGDQLWLRDLPGDTPTGPVLADDAVFVGTDSGELLALE